MFYVQPFVSLHQLKSIPKLASLILKGLGVVTVLAGQFANPLPGSGQKYPVLNPAHGLTLGQHFIEIHY